MKRAIILALVLLSACKKEKPKEEPPKPTTVAEGTDPRLVKVLDESTVRHVRDLIHPEGADGHLAVLSTTRDGDQMTAHLEIEWKTVTPASKHTTEIEWKYGPDKHVGAGVSHDDALAPIPAQARKSMNRYFEELYRRMQGDAGP